MDIRLAIFTPRIGSGDVERVIAKIASHFDADIYTPFYNPDLALEEFSNLNVIKIKSNTAKFFPKNMISDEFVSSKLFYFNKFKGYDVYNPHAAPSQLIRNRNWPVLWYSHGIIREIEELNREKKSLINKIIKRGFYSLLKKMEDKVIKEIEFVYSNSLATQRHLLNYFNKDSEVLYPGLDHNNYYFKSFENYFLVPARISPRKNLEFIIDAFKQFHKKNKDWKLIIAGSLNMERPDHINYYRSIKKFLGNMGEILTNIDDKTLFDLYARAYSVIYTPYKEDFSYVPLQSFASKKPVIVSNHKSLAEFVNPNRGFLISNKKELVDAMLTLSSKPSLAKKLGKNGYNFVKDNFSWNLFLKTYENKLIELIDFYS